MALYNRKRFKHKRLVLSVCLQILHNGTALGYLVAENRKYHSIKTQRKVAILTMTLSDDSENRMDRTPQIISDLSPRKSLASWSIQKLLSILDQYNVRYTPTASRSDLEHLLLQHLKIRNASASKDTLEPHGKIRDNQDDGYYDLSRNRSSFNIGSNEQLRELEFREQRLYKRAQRRQKWQSSRHLNLHLNKIASRALISAPNIAVNALDYARRKSRRLQRRVVDFLLLDDETGVRDVVRYEEIRREPIRIVSPQQKFVAFTNDDGVNVIVIESAGPSSDLNEESMTIAINKEQGDEDFFGDNSIETKLPEYPEEYVSSRAAWQTGAAATDIPDFSSTIRIKTKNFGVPNDTILNLPPAVSNNIQDPSCANSSGKTGISQESKKIYNPYVNSKRYDNVNDKDVIDQVSEFLTNTADRFFDRLLFDDDASAVNRPQQQRKKAPRSSNSRKSDNRQGFDNRRHWKDRLEERLDSMLGLHENGDFYRSWTERYEEEQEVEKQSEVKYDAFAVAQGRRRPNKRIQAKTKNGQPFWEEDGNIFSVLFGRQQHFEVPRFDKIRLPSWEKGSILSVMRFILKNFAVVAGYLCRWASTQGALPQPVVVLGVGSAILCARPNQRLRAAGITLLLLRVVGEVLHGYMYGSSGWDESSDLNVNDFNN